MAVNERVVVNHFDARGEFDLLDAAEVETFNLFQFRMFSEIDPLQVGCTESASIDLFHRIWNRDFGYCRTPESTYHSQLWIFTERDSTNCDRPKGLAIDLLERLGKIN
jgi:hypothetical protein